MSHCIFSKNALFGIKGMQTAIKIGFGKPYNPRFPMEFEAFFPKKIGLSGGKRACDSNDKRPGTLF